MGCFRFCTPEDLAQMIGDLSVPITLGSSDDRILQKMLRGEFVDLTNTTGRGAWGRFADRALTEAFLQAHPNAQDHVSLIKGGPQAGRRGYADIVHEHFVMDWKTDNFDAYTSERALDAKLHQIADQIESYVKSPNLPSAEVGIAYFEFSPSDSDRRDHIEDVMGQRGIGVIWGPEY